MEESVNSENYFIDIILGSKVVTEADKVYSVNQSILPAGQCIPSSFKINITQF